METNKIIEILKNYFKTKPVNRAYLFGSYVRNEQTTESDIDVLVELDFSIPIGFEYIKMCLDLEDLTGKKVDLVCEGAVSKYIAPFINQEKKLVYEKSDI